MSEWKYRLTSLVRPVAGILAVLLVAYSVIYAYHHLAPPPRPLAKGNLKNMVVVSGFTVQWVKPATVSVYDDYVIVDSADGVKIIVPRDKVTAIDISP